MMQVLVGHRTHELQSGWLAEPDRSQRRPASRKTWYAASVRLEPSRPVRAETGLGIGERLGAFQHALANAEPPPGQAPIPHCRAHTAASRVKSASEHVEHAWQ
jgi:hypothetical protein